MHIAYILECVVLNVWNFVLILLLVSQLLCYRFIPSKKWIPLRVRILTVITIGLGMHTVRCIDPSGVFGIWSIPTVRALMPLTTFTLYSSGPTLVWYSLRSLYTMLGQTISPYIKMALIGGTASYLLAVIVMIIWEASTYGSNLTRTERYTFLFMNDVIWNVSSVWLLFTMLWSLVGLNRVVEKFIRTLEEQEKNTRAASGMKPTARTANAGGGTASAHSSEGNTNGNRHPAGDQEMSRGVSKSGVASVAPAPDPSGAAAGAVVSPPLDSMPGALVSPGDSEERLVGQRLPSTTKTTRADNTTPTTKTTTLVVEPATNTIDATNAAKPRASVPSSVPNSSSVSVGVSSASPPSVSPLSSSELRIASLRSSSMKLQWTLIMIATILVAGSGSTVPHLVNYFNQTPNMDEYRVEDDDDYPVMRSSLPLVQCIGISVLLWFVWTPPSVWMRPATPFWRTMRFGLPDETMARYQHKDTQPVALRIRNNDVLAAKGVGVAPAPAPVVASPAGAACAAAASHPSGVTVASSRSPPSVACRSVAPPVPVTVEQVADTEKPTIVRPTTPWTKETTTNTHNATHQNQNQNQMTL